MQGAAHSKVQSNTHRYYEGLAQVYTQENTDSYTDDNMQTHAMYHTATQQAMSSVDGNVYRYTQSHS